jgi:hypothetical protein
MELFLSSLLTCNQAQWIAEGAILASGLSAQQRVEVIQELLIASEPGCEFEGFEDEEFYYTDESTR